MSNDVQINNAALDDFLKGDLGEFLKTTKNIEETVTSISLAHANGEITPESMHQALEGFLEQGSSVLETMAIYCNNMPDAESVNSFASLMNALSGAINKIAQLYKTEQSHRNKIELENHKHELKLKELAFRASIRPRALGDDGTDEDEAETLIEVSTKDIVNQLIEAKK